MVHVHRDPRVALGRRLESRWFHLFEGKGKTQGSREVPGAERFRGRFKPVSRVDTLKSSHLRMVNGKRAGGPRETWKQAGSLRTWKNFEGLGVAEGRVLVDASVSAGSNPQRGEPQDRLRGATNPRDVRWRKPSRWWETTKMERDSSFGKGGPTRSGKQV